MYAMAIFHSALTDAENRIKMKDVAQESLIMIEGAEGVIETHGTSVFFWTPAHVFDLARGAYEAGAPLDEAMPFASNFENDINIVIIGGREFCQAALHFFGSRGKMRMCEGWAVQYIRTLTSIEPSNAMWMLPGKGKKQHHFVFGPIDEMLANVRENFVELTKKRAS